VSEKEDIGPLVLGVISPKVIVPANFAERFDARQRRLMLAHEYTHLRRGDPVWNLISAAFRCLFWFNPLIHIGANVFRREQELACDDRVLAARRRSHRSYAAALLALEQNDQTYPALTFGPHPLKERIMQISRTKSLGRARRRAGVLAALLLGAALAAVAWAATPTTEVIADGASLEDRSKLFAFDVEVTVGDQTGSGRLTLRGDEARVLPEQVLMATDALTITYEEQEPGWRAEVSISRHGEEEFFVQAEIWQNGKLRRTPTMLIGGYNAASISISGAEAGDQDFRLELTPVPEDLLSHRISPLPVEEWPEEIREKVAAMPTSFSGDTPISEMLDQVAAAQGGLEEVTFTTPGRPLQDGSAPSEGANAETAITFSRERYYESNPDTDVPFNVYVEQEMRRFIEAENSRPDTRPEQ
jgi:hypothetical protein